MDGAEHPREPVTPAPTEAPAPEAGTTLDSEDDLDEQERESFPASDPHSDWAGPSG